MTNNRWFSSHFKSQHNLNSVTRLNPVHDINQCLSLHSEMRRLLIFPGLRQVVGSCLLLMKGLWLAFTLSPTHLLRLPNCYFTYPSRAKGTEDETDVRGEESSDLLGDFCSQSGKLSRSWVLQTHLSLRTSHMQVLHCGELPSFRGKMLPSSPWLTGDPPSGVLAAYTAALKLIVHIHSWLDVQRLQTGSWKLALAGALRKLVSKKSELIGLLPESWFLNIYQHLPCSGPCCWILLALPGSLPGWDLTRTSPVLSLLCL